MSRSLRTLAPLLGVLLLWACEDPPTPSRPPPGPNPAPTLTRRYFGKPADGKLHVYFLDVDQGDATLIVSPTGRTVLVDAGPVTAGSHLSNRLPELLTDKLDLVVLTHPHPDHYGGLSAAVAAVGARKLLEPQLPSTPQDYDAMLTSLASGGVEVFSPAPPAAPGELLRLPLGGNTELTVLWPRAPNEPLLADQTQERNSIVLRLTYKNTSVLLTGDAQEQTEKHLLERKAPLEATLLKVGAHGSFIATSAPFLTAVNPRAAIISTGAGNPERAPARDVLARLDTLKVRVFRTDRDGEVHAVSDGQHITLSPQRRAPGMQQASVEVMGREEPPPTPPTPPAVDPAAAAQKEPETPSKPANPEPVLPAKAMESGAGKTAIPTPVKGPDTGAGKTVEASASKGVDPARPKVAEAGKGKETDIDLEQGPSTASKTVKPEHPVRPPASEPDHFIASQKRKLFHVPNCPRAKQIKDENLITFSSRTEAISRGFEPHDCRP